MEQRQPSFATVQVGSARYWLKTAMTIRILHNILDETFILIYL